MQLYRQTLNLITISVCFACKHTPSSENLYPKQMVWGPKGRKEIWSIMQLYSPTLTFVTISVCVFV
jgi:hypothetical protein